MGGKFAPKENHQQVKCAAGESSVETPAKQQETITMESHSPRQRILGYSPSRCGQK